MHTAVTEISHFAGGTTADINIRVFADDFGAAVTGEPGMPAADSAMSRYSRGHFAVVDHRGRPVPLRWSGARRDGDVVRLHLTIPAAACGPGSRITSALLFERFPDQINIVRVTCGRPAVTLLFTPGDGAKALP